MKLLVLNWQDRLNPQAGGAEVHLHEIFGRLARRGHEVTLLASGWRDAPRREVVDDIDVHRVGSRHTYPVAAPRYYRRHLREENFDLIVEDLNKVPLWTPLWARSPVVLLVHHLFGATAFSTASLPVAALTWLSERPLPWFYRKLPVQVVSRSTADDLVARGFDADRIHVVHNGVDSEYFSPDPVAPRSIEPTLLYLGRLQRYKGVDLIIRALGVLKDRDIAVRLRIAGSGPERHSLRRLATDLGVADRIDFLGFVDERRKRDLLRTSWIHVLTSPKEGWGLTVMEAAACRTPTVASASPGLRDSIVHRETGVLVPHGDWRQLANELEALIRDPNAREAMGVAARRRAESFSWERSAREAERELGRVKSEG